MHDSRLVDDEITLLALGTMLLRRRWLVVRWMVLGMVVAGALAWSRPRQYVGSASFAPVATDMNRSGLASIAGQFGLSLPSGSQTLSPEFYANLIKSRSLLLPIVRDSFATSPNGRRVALLDLFKLAPVEEIPGAREDRGIARLRDVIEVSTSKATGVVSFSVATRWREVSLGITSALVRGVDDFNQRSRQGQAAAERKFIEGRLALASQQLRGAEDRLRGFLERNRMIGNSPELALERDRIEREIGFRQQVYTSLTQSYEEAKVREVRDTPVIAIVEMPSVPAEPRGRGLLRFLIAGTLLGALVAGVLALMDETARRRRGREDGEAEQFADALKDAKGEVLRPVQWIGTQIRS